MSEPLGAPARGELAAAVYEGLGLDPHTEEVALAEISENTNFNYVYRARVDGVQLYLKAAAAQPKRFPIQLPRERIYSEAVAVQRFRELCGDEVRVPAVLFLDRRRFILGLSDVGEARQVLLGLLPDAYGLLVQGGEALGRALGRVHRGTRSMTPFRPSGEDALVRYVIYDGLLAPGAKALFPDRWEQVRQAMAVREECLVHADLWPKNLLVGPGTAPAVVDFEGAHLGDPAFDLATLFAAALIPALQRMRLLRPCRELLAALRRGYREGSRGAPWAASALRRAYHYTGTFLAARGYGPFTYDMSERARQRLAGLAVSLTANPPPDALAFEARISEAIRGRGAGVRAPQPAASP